MTGTPVKLRGDDLTFAHSDHFPLRLLPPRVVQFRRVDPEKADMGFLDDDGIAVDDIALAGDDAGVCWCGRCGFRRLNNRSRRRGTWSWFRGRIRLLGWVLCVAVRPHQARQHEHANQGNNDDDFQRYMTF